MDVAQSYSLSAARQAAGDTSAAALEGGSQLQSVPAICRWTSKRISAVEGSHLVLARYSQKSSASQDDEAATGLPPSQPALYHGSVQKC